MLVKDLSKGVLTIDKNVRVNEMVVTFLIEKNVKFNF